VDSCEPLESRDYAIHSVSASCLAQTHLIKLNEGRKEGLFKVIATKQQEILCIYVGKMEGVCPSERCLPLKKKCMRWTDKSIILALS
jgi:hypothetical protein